MKIRITRQMEYQAVTGGIFIVGAASWRLAATDHLVPGVILLIMAVTFTIGRDVAFPFEVRGFPPA